MIWKRLWWRFLNFVFKVFAKAQGYPDPILIVTRLRRFAQPSDLTAPQELLRAGAVMQARGLMNSQAIQHNMDWVWPYWVERQFDPNDESFLPRAFNLSHLNLTNRNWTAVGVPDSPELPIVDPRGLVTPFFDDWSLDAWVITREGFNLIPSRLKSARQEFLIDGNPRIRTESGDMGVQLSSEVQAYDEAGVTVCRMHLEAEAPTGGWLVVSLRPYNTEGVSFVHEISSLKDRPGWKTDGKQFVYFDAKPERMQFSHYWDGDVFKELPSSSPSDKIDCAVGLATAAAMFELKPGKPREIRVDVPLKKNAAAPSQSAEVEADKKWAVNLERLCLLRVPDAHFQFLYDAAVRSLILHAPLDVYPGPYTYKRFWFRDAAFILNAMLSIGMKERAEKVIDRFHTRQLHDGYFLSQDGEWDSNGEALWAMRRFCELTGAEPKPEWKRMIYKAAHWIQKKRIMKGKDVTIAGLLPVGFSAEHLGPNDHYYWDDFWGIAGLRAGAYFAERFGDPVLSATFMGQAEDLLRCTENSLEAVHRRTLGKFMPASPHRRMDAGAIGSITAGYPLQILDAHDPGLVNTAEFLFKDCFLQGGFFQEISHSGINAYLTLHVAQIFLRAGDARFYELMKAIASMASPTGQWPEAIHPRTKGGCMGDGQHIWAAAEWVMMLRNSFVLEEESDRRLILCAGIHSAWLKEGAEMSLGPAETTFGTVDVSIAVRGGTAKIRWSGRWRGSEPSVEIRLPGFPPLAARPGEDSLELRVI